MSQPRSEKGTSCRARQKRQRVEFGYNSGAEVNALNTEGYCLLDSYLNIGYAEDVVMHYGANRIHPEHRFFGSSRPKDMSKLLADIVFTKEQKEAFSYDPAFCKALVTSIDTTPAEHLMLYGATDPWTSIRIHDTDNENVTVHIHPTGSHLNSTISDYPEKQQEELWAYMDSCLYS